MRVAMVTAEYPPAVGGVGDHAARLARELSALGQSVQVVTSLTSRAGSASSAGGLAEAGKPAVFQTVRRWDWRIFGLLPGLARRQRWDVLHIQYQPGAFGLHPAINLLPHWLRRTRHAPAIVTTFHDLRVPYLFPRAGPLRQLAVRQLAGGSDGIIAVTQEDLASLVTWTEGASRRVAAEHIPLGNQLDAAPPADFDRAAWRSAIGVPPAAALVGHLGLINRSKAVDALVHAVGLLVKAGRNVHLLMIGEPVGSSDATNRVYLREVQRLLNAWELARRVHWTGFQPADTLAGWLRCVDVAALPFRDGASLRRTSLIAAWAHGAPVLTTEPARPADWSGEAAPSGRAAAATVRSPDAETLAAALGDLLDNPARRAALQAAGMTFAARFAWPQVARRTLEVYRAARHAK